MNLVRSTIVIGTNRMCTCKNISIASRRHVHGTQRTLMSEETSQEKDKKNEELSLDDISEPTNCCMSGCANCVWIQYAEKLSSTLEKSDVDVQKLIMEKIQDPNMRAFLSMELRCRNLIK